MLHSSRNSYPIEVLLWLDLLAQSAPPTQQGAPATRRTPLQQAERMLRIYQQLKVLNRVASTSPVVPMLGLQLFQEARIDAHFVRNGTGTQTTLNGTLLLVPHALEPSKEQIYACMQHLMMMKSAELSNPSSLGVLI